MLFIKKKDHFNHLRFWNFILDQIEICWIIYVRSFFDRNKVIFVQIKYRWWVYSNIYCNRWVSTTKISWSCQYWNWWHMAFGWIICCHFEHAFRGDIELAISVFHRTLWCVFSSSHETQHTIKPKMADIEQKIHLSRSCSAKHLTRCHKQKSIPLADNKLHQWTKAKHVNLACISKEWNWSKSTTKQTFIGEVIRTATVR